MILIMANEANLCVCMYVCMYKYLILSIYTNCANTLYNCCFGKTFFIKGDNHKFTKSCNNMILTDMDYYYFF